jgi:hypothetical protein
MDTHAWCAGQVTLWHGLKQRLRQQALPGAPPERCGEERRRAAASEIESQSWTPQHSAAERSTGRPSVGQRGAPGSCGTAGGRGAGSTHLLQSDDGD